MKISVLLSVFNMAKYIAETIESILAQSFQEYELLIMDDGSSDGTNDILYSFNDPRIYIFHQDNKGLARSLNFLLHQSVGMYIARIDGDDVCLPQRFQVQYEFLENNRQCVVVGSNAKVMDANGSYLYTSNVPQSWHDVQKHFPHSPFFHSSVLIRKGPLVKIGGYSDKVRHHFEDIILWHQLAKFGELRNIGEPLISYRLVPSAITNRTVKESRKMLLLTEKILQGIELSEEDEQFLVDIDRTKSQNWKKSNYYLRIGKIYVEENFHRANALTNFFLAVMYWPLNYFAWFNMLLSLMPRPIITHWKMIRAKNSNSF